VRPDSELLRRQTAEWSELTILIGKNALKAEMGENEEALSSRLGLVLLSRLLGRISCRNRGWRRGVGFCFLAASELSSAQRTSFAGLRDPTLGARTKARRGWGTHFSWWVEREKSNRSRSCRGAAPGEHENPANVHQCAGEDAHTTAGQEAGATGASVFSGQILRSAYPLIASRSRGPKRAPLRMTDQLELRMTK